MRNLRRISKTAVACHLVGLGIAEDGAVAESVTLYAALYEIVGWHTAKIGDRWAALEPIRQGVRHAFGAFGKEIARGLRLRCDWGPHYIADAWINEVTLHHPYQSGCRERRPRRGHLQHRLHPWVEPDHDHGGLKGRAILRS